MFLALSYRFGMSCCMSIQQFVDISFLNGSHTSAVNGNNFTMYFIIPEKDVTHFCLVEGLSVTMHSLLGYGCILSLDINLPKHGVLVHLKLHLFYSM